MYRSLEDFWRGQHLPDKDKLESWNSRGWRWPRTWWGAWAHDCYLGSAALVAVRQSLSCRCAPTRATEWKPPRYCCRRGGSCKSPSQPSGSHVWKQLSAGCKFLKSERTRTRIQICRHGLWAYRERQQWHAIDKADQEWCDKCSAGQRDPGTWGVSLKYWVILKEKAAVWSSGSCCRQTLARSTQLWTYSLCDSSSSLKLSMQALYITKYRLE